MEWKNYGDVNPRQHGGLWIALDEDGMSGCYYVVRWTPFSKIKEIGIGYMDDLYVDITDCWIDWPMVNNFSGIDMDASSIDKVIGMVAYYDYQNFGDRLIVLNDEDYEKQLSLAKIPVCIYFGEYFLNRKCIY